jgi:hypothetical protein
MTPLQTICFALRREDPRYRGIRARNGRIRDIYGAARLYNNLQLTDRRTWEQREAAQFGRHYGWMCAARAESANLTRVRKAQTALQRQAPSAKRQAPGRILTKQEAIAALEAALAQCEAQAARETRQTR